MTLPNFPGHFFVNNFFLQFTSILDWLIIFQYKMFCDFVLFPRNIRSCILFSKYQKTMLSFNLISCILDASMIANLRAFVFIVRILTLSFLHTYWSTYYVLTVWEQDLIFIIMQFICDPMISALTFIIICNLAFPCPVPSGHIWPWKRDMWYSSIIFNLPKNQLIGTHVLSSHYVIWGTTYLPRELLYHVL